MQGKPKSVLKLDFITGASILETLSEMKEKASQFNVAFIYSKLNDIDVYVRKETIVSEAYAMFQDAIKNNKEFIVC